MNKLNFNLKEGSSYYVSFNYTCFCGSENKVEHLSATSYDNGKKLICEFYCPNCGQHYSSYESKNISGKNIFFYFDAIMSYILGSRWHSIRHTTKFNGKVQK